MKERKRISFNELRQIKDNLPDGSIQKMAQKLKISEETVRNYFGGHNYKNGDSCGNRIEQGGIDGGIVELGDAQILEMALEIIAKQQK